ncbi:MAG: tRNA 2-thiocytidine biosynthesis protein TtcA [Bacilli bacterium]|nr:tRNA 2-thiocytidine biosynthesis protein TtcA [Bacilli bacterium]
MEYQEIERSIIKKFRKKLWCRFARSIDEYQLVQDGDKIAVCISGGKDSFILAKLFQELKRHGRIDFELEFIVMNPGYNKENLEQIRKNLELLNIPAVIFESNIFDVVDDYGGNSPCYLCARMRRGALYSKAQELGCNKIALGHHFNDVIETIMLNILYAGEYKAMMPKLKSENFPGMELIRPMYYVKEEDIIAWAKYNNLKFINCACKLTSRTDIEGKRKEIKKLIEELKKINENVDINILRSSQNINLDSIIGYKINKEKINFLDKY